MVMTGVTVHAGRTTSVSHRNYLRYRPGEVKILHWMIQWHNMSSAPVESRLRVRWQWGIWGVLGFVQGLISSLDPLYKKKRKRKEKERNRKNKSKCSRATKQDHSCQSRVNHTIPFSQPPSTVQLRPCHPAADVYVCSDNANSMYISHLAAAPETAPRLYPILLFSPWVLSNDSAASQSPSQDMSWNPPSTLTICTHSKKKGLTYSVSQSLTHSISLSHSPQIPARRSWCDT